MVAQVATHIKRLAIVGDPQNTSRPKMCGKKFNIDEMNADHDGHSVYWKHLAFNSPYAVASSPLTTRRPRALWWSVSEAGLLEMTRSLEV